MQEQASGCERRWSYYLHSSSAVSRGGATIVKVAGTISLAPLVKQFFDPHLWLIWGGGHETGYCSFLYCNYDVWFRL